MTADTYEELFKGALDGMNHIIMQELDERLELKEKLDIESVDRNMLLIDFLSEVLTLSHSNGAVYRVAKFHDLSDTSLSAAIEGRKVNEFDEDIKAVTYTESVIKKNSAGHYETTIVFDI